ncbi:MAG: DUF362 domain-containing protein [Spirochaetaceae bacterium]|jgi:uncharacterized Fe-S center protein|nr:DUF362 domain-containing protein [Spirochaetaceae bacterium]
MANKVLFSNMAFTAYEAEQTLPRKLERQLLASGLGDRVKDKTVAIKVHVGSEVGYTTIPPVFMRLLAQFVKDHGGNCFFTDHYVAMRHPEHRGYTQESLGAPVLDVAGYLGKYLYTKEVHLKSFRHVDIGGLIHDADFLIDFSHVKGHGCCAYGGAVKNIAMGCVSDRTRREQHGLEGGLKWDGEKCTHCEQCIAACNHKANSFTKEGEYTINFHNCTLCQHCLKVCPVGAITKTDASYLDFQKGLALCTKTVLDTFEPGNVFFINLLISITAMCDCWGMTTPALVPDIGVMSSWDIAAIEKASLDQITWEKLNPEGIPVGITLGNKGHLFERLHGKDPYSQLGFLEELGLGKADYTLEMVK